MEKIDKEKLRCGWTGNDPLLIEYHDCEWGVPVQDDRKLFEFMVLDAFQAGLSWKTILYKRENFRKAFDNFDYNLIAKYDDNKVIALLEDASIIRNKLKVYSTINNAGKYLEVIQEFGSFSTYLWSFTGNKTIKNTWNSLTEIPAKTEISDLISKDLKKRGFNFVGSTIIYSFLQAAGLVNDHVISCFRYNQCGQFL